MGVLSLPLPNVTPLAHKHDYNQGKVSEISISSPSLSSSLSVLRTYNITSTLLTKMKVFYTE
jgi:hypothetical protein